MKLVWLVLLFVFWEDVAYANDKETKLEVIEVTAQKRQESIQKVPISITALDPVLMDKLYIKNMSELDGVVPNLTSTRSIGGIYNFYIRGIGMDGFNLASVPAVGIYVDDVAINNPMLANFSLYDIARIEVLRGPQNALFGKNTTGGAVNVITEGPQSEGANNLRASIGNYGLFNLSGGATMAINEEWSGRITGFRHYRSGLLTNSERPNEKYHNIDRSGFRIKGQAQLSDSLTFSFGVNGGRQRQISEIKTLAQPSQDSNLIDIGSISLSEVSTSLIKPRNDIDVMAGNVKFLWELDFAKLNVISSFEQVESYRKDDWGSQNVPSSVYQIVTFNSSDTISFSQEFQLVSKTDFDWIAGLLFTQDRGDLLQTAYIDPAGPGRPDDAVNDAGIGPLFDRGSWVENDTFSTSIYGQTAYSLSPNLSLTAGLRVTHQELSPTVNAAGMLMDSKEKPFPLGTFGWFSLGNPDFDIFTDYAGFDAINNFKQANGGFPASAQVDRKFNEWGGKMAINYQADDHLLMYASLSRGFKMGAVNSNPTTSAFISLLDKVAEPERLVTAEIGIKYELENRELRINTALFNNEWENYQFYQVYNPGDPVKLFASLINLPKARSYGAEVELNWYPSRDWRIDGGLGWLKTKVVDGNLSTTGIPDERKQDFQNSVVAGNELTNSPEWTSNIAVHRYFNFVHGELDLLLHYQFIDAHIHQLAGMNSTQWQSNMSEKSKSIWSFSAVYNFGESKQFQISTWVKNISNTQSCLERAIIPGLSAETDRLCAQSEPRTLGFSFVYRME